jgi:hypothetical protein
MFNSSFVKITGMTRGGILEAMDQIVQRGILTETLRKDSMGRGTATQFEFARNVFEQIRM